MIYFMDVTQKKDVAQYVNDLDENTLFIYSPTSINKINYKNKKIKAINWHEISKEVRNIDEIVKENYNLERVVAFGGGSAIDIGKYIAYKLNIEFVCIPSMLSTNSYATNKVALIQDGKKITFDAKMPNCIILDNKILEISKIENLYGLADVLSIYTALYDWKLALEDIDEEVDYNIYEMSSNLLNEVINFILNNTLEKIMINTEKIFEYIGKAGYITNLYGSGRPESGSEHIFAKELESRIDIPHGIAVSLGIIIMTMMQGREIKNIMKVINKIRILDKKDMYGVDKNIIGECVRNLKPREGRYTVVNKQLKNFESIIKKINNIY